jgi:hypothetical protein
MAVERISLVVGATYGKLRDVKNGPQLLFFSFDTPSLTVTFRHETALNVQLARRIHFDLSHGS